MRWPDIAQYIADFEKFARQAGYTQGNAETTDLFLKGLPARVLTDVLKPPYAVGYNATKQKALEATQALVLLDAIVSAQRPQTAASSNRSGGNAPSYASPSTQGNAPYRPFFSQNYGGGGNYKENNWNNNQQRGGQQQQPQQRQYNSTNAPRWMNNQPVPMDVDRARAPNWRGRGGGPVRGRAATTQGPPHGNSNGACFQCGQQGHFARNCPMRQKCDYANLIDFNEDDQEYFGSEPSEEDPVEDIKARLACLGKEAKAKLADEMGVMEDFPLA